MLYELGKCPGPCAIDVDEAKYREVIEEMKDFLLGKNEKILKDIEQRIAKAVSAWKFEEAQALKERHQAIKGMVEKQHVHEHFGKNRDVWAFAEEETKLIIVLLSFRRGVLISRRHFKAPLFSETSDEAITTFLFQYYGAHPIPDEIILSEEIEDMDYLEKHLEESRREKLKILGPQHRSSQDMVRLAIENLHETEPVALDEAFRRALRLKTNPARIEVYDISHIHGKNPTGAMVVFENFQGLKKCVQGFSYQRRVNNG